MVSFFSLGFMVALVTAGATRMDRSEEVQVDNSYEAVCPGGMGRCCTSKCSGREDYKTGGKLSKCRVKAGQVFSDKSAYNYKCKESCDLEREYVVQFSTKGWFGRKKGKKSQRTKTERVIVKRGGGYLSGGSCSS
ncbi:unnamed protein product [Durusdinium trenchii]|uniref:Uncharacterized protein n=1 Tax=Durusdinium trenchii TaxID=1381693 RepID=A0ABP0I7H2_9DINO